MLSDKAPHKAEFTAGGMIGAYWDLQPGEGIPMHEHDENKEHLTLVCWGEVKITGDQEMTLQAGQATYFPGGHKHEIEATQPTRIYNIWRANMYYGDAGA